MQRSKKYLQLAFNYTFNDFVNLIRYIPKHNNIIIEAGTPLIKREGISVVSRMRSYWPGLISADMKIVDGAKEEVLMAKNSGADFVTAVGNASDETLKIFVDTCKESGIYSVVDMINTSNPLKRLWSANVRPDVALIHRGRDEENSYGKVIQYKNIAKIKGKYDSFVGAAGGIDKKEMSSASFNGSDITVVNIVKPTDPWNGIKVDREFKDRLDDFIRFVD